MNRIPMGAALLAVLGICLVAGCSKEARDEIADQLQQSADTVAEKAGRATEAAANVTEQATAAVDVGNMEIRLDAPQPVTANGCYGQWIEFSDGRSSVLQLASYSEAQRETFPSMFVRAIVDPGTSNIFNQTLKAKVFVQSEENGPVYYTADNGLVDLAIGPQGETVTATLASGQLLRSDTGAAVPVQGTLVFTLQ